MTEVRVERAERSEWGDLLAAFPDRTPFHGLPWLDALAAARRMTPVLVRASVAGRVVAVWPVLETRKGPLRILGSPLPGTATAYMGPLFRAEADARDVLAAFLRHEALRRYAYFGCRTVERTRAVDLAPFGFAAVRRLSTYWIDLTQTEDTLWANLKSECRTQIRKAERLGVEVRQESSAEFIEPFWRMSLETFARSGTRPTYDEALVREVWNRLHGASRLLVLSAFHEGTRLATLVLPNDDRVMVYWGGASAQAYRHLPSNNLLHWQAIREARRLGLAGYDLISTNGGPGRFKKTLGADAVDVGTEWERSPSGWLAFLKKHYERLRRKRLGIASSRAA